MVSIVLLRIREIPDVKQETRGECADQQRHRQLVRYSVYPFQCRLQCFAKYLDTLARNKQDFNCSLEKYRRQLSTSITLLGAVNLPSNLARGFSY